MLFRLMNVLMCCMQFLYVLNDNAWRKPDRYGGLVRALARTRRQRVRYVQNPSYYLYCPFRSCRQALVGMLRYLPRLLMSFWARDSHTGSAETQILTMNGVLETEQLLTLHSL
jgi:hypothetical protein